MFCKPIQGIFYFNYCLFHLVLYISYFFADTFYLSTPSPEQMESTQGNGSDLILEVIVLPTGQQRNPWFGQATLACWMTNRPPPPANPRVQAGGAQEQTEQEAFRM